MNLRDHGVLRAGFTLLEVLVSLAMVAVAAVVLGAAYVNVLFSYHSMQGREDEESDVAFARSLVLAEARRAAAEDGGRFERADGGTLRWDAVIEETDVADLFQVTLNLEFLAAGAAPARERRETFLVLRPEWSEPDRREALRAAFRQRLERRRSP